MQIKIMDTFHSVALGRKREGRKGGEEPTLILYSSTNLLGIKHRSGRHIWWNASHEISIKGIEILRRLADNSPSNVLLFRLLKKLESQISCEMSDTKHACSILKVKIKDTVSKLALQTKQAQRSPRGCGANFIRSPWLLPPNSLSFKKNNNNENAFLSVRSLVVRQTN